VGRFKIIIPTYNAGIKFKQVLEMLLKQDGVCREDIFVIDSSSTDGTEVLVRQMGIELEVIPKDEFGHGKTRTFVAQKFADKDILIFMTHDALPKDEFSIKTLCNFLNSDVQMAAAYGRQIPYEDTDVFGKHARLYNYPAESNVRVLSDKEKFGIKTTFFSDTFAAYKTDKLQEIGWFPDVNFGEDTCVAGKLLMAGYKIGYCASAKVYHSHSFTLWQEFQRCREIGRFHKNQHWLLQTFGKAEGEGICMVKDQARYLISMGKWYLLPELIIRNGLKFVGYKVG